MQSLFSYSGISLFTMPSIPDGWIESIITSFNITEVKWVVKCVHVVLLSLSWHLFISLSLFPFSAPAQDRRLVWTRTPQMLPVLLVLPPPASLTTSGTLGHIRCFHAQIRSSSVIKPSSDETKLDVFYRFIYTKKVLHAIEELHKCYLVV